MVSLGMEQPFERGVSGNGSYLDHEAATSISGGSSPFHVRFMSKKAKAIELPKSGECKNQT